MNSEDDQNRSANTGQNPGCFMMLILFVLLLVLPPHPGHPSE